MREWKDYANGGINAMHFEGGKGISARYRSGEIEDKNNINYLVNFYNNGIEG
jgi:hypothetical protein